MHRPDTPAERPQPISRRHRGRRRLPLPVRPVLLFAGLTLLVNSLVGERSVLQRVRARREDRALASIISTLRRENLELRERARRLREDPAAVEVLARRELELLRPGEVLVIVRGSPPRPDPVPP